MKLSIGEMAKLHDISVQTLHYYDKIDLLKPSEVDRFSNYRFYHDKDCIRLERIKIFKSIGLPLRSIKKLLDGHLADTERLYSETQEVVKEKMNNLNIVMSYLEDQLQDIQDFRNREYSIEPTIDFYEKREGYLINVDELTSFKNRIQALNTISRNYKANADILFKPSRLMGLTLDGKIYLKSLLALYRDKYKGEQDNYILEKGYYGVINHIGSRIQISKSYNKLLNYIKDREMEAKDEAIEIIIISSDLSINSDEHVVQIQIPIK